MPRISVRALPLLFSLLLLSCQSSNTLLPGWQQDTALIYNGSPAAQAQRSTTPHLVVRACYGAPGHVERLVARQDDSPQPVKNMAVMGDGTLALGFSDAATGKWLEMQECGGQIFVAGLPHQAYRIHLQNLTPMPLDLALGIDGKDLATGGTASWSRSSIRIEAKKALLIDHLPSGRGPLLFKSVHGDRALFETHPSGCTGLIQIAAWLAADAPSLPGQTLRPSQYAPGTLIPIDRPEQYR
ncbi:MAG: hypothetical protein JNG86_16730 [Verrucomicrobiaceae bacterium]|nr:hypothetical protein [Verrucomicrobiaceae bacterium]